MLQDIQSRIADTDLVVRTRSLIDQIASFADTADLQEALELFCQPAWIRPAEYTHLQEMILSMGEHARTLGSAKSELVAEARTIEVRALLQTLTPTLVPWIEQHRHEIQTRSPLLAEVLKPGGKLLAMKRLIEGENVLAEIWSSVVDTMQVAADETVRSYGQFIQLLLAKGQPLSPADQRALGELADRIAGGDSRTEFALVQRALQNDALSKRVRDGIAQYLHIFQVGEPTPQVKWSWGACVFCGALGYIVMSPGGVGAGVAGAIVGCIACGVLAEP